jgi:hypothetical protein
MLLLMLIRIGHPHRYLVKANSKIFLRISTFNFFKNFFYYHIIVELGLHCDIYKSAYMEEDSC